MSANAGSGIPITADEVAAQLAAATQYLRGVSYAPQRELQEILNGTPSAAKLTWADSAASMAGKSKSVSLLAIAKQANKGDELLAEPISSALNIIRTGLQIALHVAQAYANASGYAQLQERNKSRSGQLGTDQAEWASKQETHAAITAFVLASYVTWRFESKDEKKYTTNVDFAGLPEPITIGNQVRAIGCVFYHLGSYLERAQTGSQFHKLVQLYFAAVLKELQTRAPSLKYSEPFTDPTYKLVDTTFHVSGFKAAALGSSVVEFKRVELREIVGNQDSKRLALRLSQHVLAYDFTRKLNPLTEFGAFPWIQLLQGVPGTGKSMILAALQTLVQDYCKALGMPYEIHPIPNGIISSMQGDSAVNYENWWQRISNPEAIIVAPVDDAEAVYLDRRDHSSSEGSKLIVMCHLRLTEGSTALNRGNVLQPHATNNADMIDPAVFSRYQARAGVPGAQTRNDFMDQMRLWGDGLNKKAGSGLIGLSWPDDYTFLSDQGLVPKDEAEQKVDGMIRFKNEGVARLWEKIEERKLSLTSYNLYGTFFAELHRMFPGFTSRDVRNITVSATSRLFGFDFPQEWLESRGAFVAKDYDTKKQMILDAALQYQKGLSVDQILFQETAHYVDATIAMLDSGRQRRIRQKADEMAEYAEARSLAAQGTPEPETQTSSG